MTYRSLLILALVSLIGACTASSESEPTSTTAAATVIETLSENEVLEIGSEMLPTQLDFGGFVPLIVDKENGSVHFSIWLEIDGATKDVTDSDGTKNLIMELGDVIEFEGYTFRLLAIFETTAHLGITPPPG